MGDENREEGNLKDRQKWEREKLGGEKWGRSVERRLKWGRG